MTAEQLEELLGYTGSTDDHLHFGAIEKLKAIAPSLASRVIAAEKLAREVQHYTYGNAPLHSLRSALTAYREASK